MKSPTRILMPVRALAVVAILALGFGCSEVEDPSLSPTTDARFAEPAPPLRDLGRNVERNVFWGDLHIHTSLSYDAYTFGVRAMPDDAYAFAKGNTIQHGVGYPIRARRPLDFAAVTDHAEYLGVPRSRGDADPDPPASLREVLETKSPLRITWYFLQRTLFEMGSSETRDEVFGGEYADENAEVSSAAWREIVAAADRHDDPGRFTAFIAYEWTSMPSEYNLHRNVVYRSSRAPDFPYSSLDSDNPEDLWRALEKQRSAGMEVIAIPHNGNVSNGLMYDRVSFDGSPLSPGYAETRMKNEPISEILQVKGSSETHPILSSEDEFADFEIFDQVLDRSGDLSEPRGSYARYALRTGLELSARSGFNPYRFGVIGSSDSHNASSSVEEDNYHGKLPLMDGTVGLRLGESTLLPKEQNRGGKWSAQGLAAVWAEENTRAALFDAMRRKETYATSGPRITVRFFGGWDFEPGLVGAPDFVTRAYAQGVPMGGALAPDKESGAPHFAIVALKDPIGANLDRIQIVKGWVDADGASHERIYDVAASGGRVPDTAHRVSPVGNTVDVATARYTNSIGAAQLSIVWRDPDFDPTQEAFYYARVLEIPTPRWSTFDARAMGIPAPDPATLQERAITSAIWYRPGPSTQ
jgi:hypothetical protein